eukprot:10492570-Alexandrium_andersonii.AAC.1
MGKPLFLRLGIGESRSPSGTQIREHQAPWAGVASSFRRFQVAERAALPVGQARAATSLG